MWMWMWAAACTNETAVDSGAPRTWEGDFLIEEIIIDCDASGWTYSVRTLGWGDEITVDVVARAFGLLVWSENHTLSEVDYGDDWALYEVELDYTYTEADYASSSSTLFSCEEKTAVTYGFAAWRYDDEMQECVAWGVDPVGEFPSCTSWGDNGHDNL